MTGFRIPVTPEAENPRWMRCRYTLGHEPPGRDFDPWMARGWIEFCREHGVKDQDAASDKPRLGLHDAFDAWHDAAVSAGRFTWVEPATGTDE